MTTKKSAPAWWRAFGWRPRAARPGVGPDFADMGTVFGLEASLAASDDGKQPEHRGGQLDTAETRQRGLADRLNGRSVR